MVFGFVFAHSVFLAFVSIGFHLDPFSPSLSLSLYFCCNILFALLNRSLNAHFESGFAICYSSLIDTFARKILFVVFFFLDSQQYVAHFVGESVKR